MMGFEGMRKLDNRNVIRSFLIVGYIVAVLLFAGLAKAGSIEVFGDFSPGASEKLARVLRTA